MIRPSTRAARLAALALFLAVPACKDGTSSGPNPTPGIEALSPPAADAGSADLELTVTGSDFVRGSVVRWNGTDLATRYVSRTQLAATVPAARLASAGQAAVTVFNPAPGGGGSNTAAFVVQVRVNPVPTLTSVSPAQIEAGSAGATLTLTGTGFVPESKAYTGTTERQTQYVSATELRVILTPAEVAAAGTLQFRVVSPFPGGGVSNTVTLTLAAPVPSIASINPQQANAGALSQEVTVTGSGFVANSEVRFNGSARPTLLVAPGQLRATLAAGDLQAAGTYQITVVNPAPGGGTSGPASLVLVNGTPSIAFLSSYGATAGGTGFTLMVHGTGFVSGSTVRWNGADRPTTYLTSSRLAVSISADDVAAPGAVQVSVFNPAPGGGASVAGTVQVRALAPAATLNLKTLDLPTQDVAWLPSTGRLYVSLPSSSPQYANSVAVVDPVSGGVTASVFVGSEPSFLAAARDGGFVYVALDGSSTVRRVTPSPLAAGLEFATGRVEEMETMPGNSQTVAISLMNPGSSPRHLGVCLYDTGIRRTRCTQGHTGSNSIEFGETGSALYGYNNETTEFGYRTIGVLPDGLQELRVTGGLIGSFYTRIHYASGRIYSNNGVVLDADRHVVVGSFASGLVNDALPDPVLGRVFTVSGSGTLTAWDMNTFTSLGSITLPGFYDDHPALRRVRIVRWGADGLAVSDGHKLFIVRTTLAAS